MKFKAKVLDSAAIERALARIAHEIIENTADSREVILVGILRRGLPLAERIADNIRRFSELSVTVASLDTAPYRDDRRDDGARGGNELPDSEGKTVVLVDDVICTGRTVRAALDALIDQGRPACVRLAVLVDRGHRELPIRGDYVGKNIPTSRREIIKVNIPPVDDSLDTCLYAADE